MFTCILGTSFEPYFLNMVETIINMTDKERAEELNRLTYKIQTPFGVIRVRRDGRTEEEVREVFNY